MSYLIWIYPPELVEGEESLGNIIITQVNIASGWVIVNGITLLEGIRLEPFPLFSQNIANAAVFSLNSQVG